MECCLITGSSCGVGRATALKFLKEGYKVYGLDIKEATIKHINYYHFVCDVSLVATLPNIVGPIHYIVNNAGIVSPQRDAIAVNQLGYINILETYGKNPALKSIVQVGSTASYKGYDNIRYCSSQGARDALTKWAANNFGNDPRHVIVNALNLDGIVPADPSKGIEGTCLEPELYAEDGLLDKIKDLSVLKKLATTPEIAEWIYFLLVVNKIMTGQILSVDGELIGAYKFIKYKGWDD